jgi:hypothetical protein
MSDVSPIAGKLEIRDDQRRIFDSMMIVFFEKLNCFMSIRFVD